MKQSRFLAFAAFMLALWGCGRNATSPPPDTNRSPETVLVATPYDTTFLKTPVGGIPTAVFYRYHAHWYGTDPDGKVTGFVVVVTDTNGAPGIFQFLDPRNFTTRTDSIFSFRVNANSQRYPHTIWVTAIDDKGKADFSPAHVIVNAEDRFLPEPQIDSAYAVSPGGLVIQLKDSNTNSSIAPRDTIPVGSRVRFVWHGITEDPFGKIVGYRIRLNDYNAVTTDTSASFVSVQLKNGRNEFHLRGIDGVGGETGAGGNPDTVRLFAYNFAPGTWIADPNNSLGPPELRPQSNRFMEVVNGRLFPHLEGDTIPRTSDIRLAFGGWDRDGQVRGFSVDITQVAASGVGSNSLPPTPTTPPPGTTGLFEPFVNEPFEFTVGSDTRAGTRTFHARGFDYDGQVDPEGARVRVIYGFRPYFKGSEITVQVPNQAIQKAFPDTLVLVGPGGLPPPSINVTCKAYDGNDRTGKTLVGSPLGVPNSYQFTLDPESQNSVQFERTNGVFNLPLKLADGTTAIAKGFHVLQVTVNDYLPLANQSLVDGRTASVRIPFFYVQKTP